MQAIGPFIMQMTDQEYWSHMDHCGRVAVLLSQAIDKMMRFIFEGRATTYEQWESLFTAINQAVLMKNYLSMNCANLLNIAEDFLAQVADWQQEITETLN